MTTITCLKEIQSPSDTFNVTKKEGNIERIVKSLNINNEPLHRTILEEFSQTLEKNKVNNHFSSTGLTYSTSIAEITISQPQASERKKTTASSDFYKKLKARAKEKITFLDKALDAYGVIDEVTYCKNHKEIHARVYDISSHEIIDEITFSSDEFSKSDQKRLVESAIFYWYVGVERTLLGQEKRVSEFRLRRVFGHNSLKNI
ncbi:hypothetical protein QNZ44_003468 [Enterobacter kobei]